MEQGIFAQDDEDFTSALYHTIDAVQRGYAIPQEQQELVLLVRQWIKIGAPIP